MPRRTPQLAKLTQPRLHNAVTRDRLFEVLDEKREHPVVWIVGPPGAGKTTLAASYLEEAGVPAVWYQMDPGDSDPATFFFYLKQAIEAVAKGKAKPLPLLTPEYLPDLPGFARRFLRDGFSQLPDDAILVFDNYHDIAGDSALHAPFRATLGEVPPGSNVIVLSRSAPPVAFADALVNQTIVIVSWEDLRLTPEETAALAVSRGITDSNLLRLLHEQSAGWIAGVTLMLESLRRGGSLEALHQAQALDTIFDYFAGLIFDNAYEEMREVLMKTAFLPRVSSTLAAAVTGKSDAIRYIEDLHRRHLFTDRNFGTEITYQYHALFRAFLKSRAGVVYTIKERHEIAKRAAASLAAAGQIEDAFALYAEAEDWDTAEQLLISSAANLIAQGRWQTLGQWVEALPRDRLDANPWVRYWMGRSKTFFDHVAARPALETAYRIFEKRCDDIGQLLCATSILEGFYFQFDNFRPMDPWIARVVTLLQRGVRPPSKEDELRANSAVMMGATYRAPQHSMLDSCLRRVEELLKEPFEPNIKVAAAAMLHSYSNVAMDALAERMASMIARPLLNSKDLSPLRALFYWQAEGYSHYVRGRYAQALACFDAADAVVREHSFQYFKPTSANWRRGVCERRAGLLDEAEATLRRAEALPIPATGYRHGGLTLLRAVVAFDRGNTQHAIETVLEAYKAYDDTGFFNGIVTVGTVASNMAIAGGRFDVADQILDRLRAEEYGTIAENYLAAIVLNQAWLAHRRGNVGSRDLLLGDAMRRARMDGARVRFHWYANAMAELLPIALSRGIEPDIARQIAREFDVVPVGFALENWPWPIKVYTLGRFELLIDGESPGYSRKAPKKVLALLKAIIAHGGKDVPEQKLIDALWLDEEGDAARRALTATLHRLRKLLRNGKAIRQTGGELTLDDQICWIDALAFERQIEGHQIDPNGFDEATGLYRGAFLAQEDGTPWIITSRERLRSKFIHAIGKLGSSLETAGRYETAIDFYIRGVEADPLVEPFYQGLMRCYDHLDRRSEAASAYRRLRQTLSVTLGVPPSTESQRLFATLRQN